MHRANEMMEMYAYTLVLSIPVWNTHQYTKLGNKLDKHFSNKTKGTYVITYLIVATLQGRFHNIENQI